MFKDKFKNVMGTAKEVAGSIREEITTDDFKQSVIESFKEGAQELKKTAPDMAKEALKAQLSGGDAASVIRARRDAMLEERRAEIGASFGQVAGSVLAEAMTAGAGGEEASSEAAAEQDDDLQVGLA